MGDAAPNSPKLSIGVEVSLCRLREPALTGSTFSIGVEVSPRASTSTS